MSERSKVGDRFYCYCDPWNEASARLGLETFRVQRITPKGYWLEIEYTLPRFVLHDARKSFAYPTKELALRSYIIRKQRQLEHLASTRRKAERGLEIAKELLRGKPACDVFVFGEFDLEKGV